MKEKFTRENSFILPKPMKRCSASLFIREVRINITLRYHLIPFTVSKIRLTLPSVDKDVKKQELSNSTGRNTKRYNYLGNHLDDFFHMTQSVYS